MGHFLSKRMSKRTLVERITGFLSVIEKEILNFYLDKDSSLQARWKKSTSHTIMF